MISILLKKTPAGAVTDSTKESLLLCFFANLNK